MKDEQTAGYIKVIKKANRENTQTNFDELLDEVAEEFGSKKGLEDTHESTQSEETGSVDVGGESNRTEGESSKTTREGRREGSGFEGTNQSQVQASGGNAEDEVDRREDNGIAWSPVGEMPTKTSKRRVNLTTARRKDLKTQDMSAIFGFGLDKFATYRKAARDVFNATNLGKPYWAVVGCVLLRDQGICQLCGDRIGRKFEVVQIMPNKLGGSFNEGNCMSLCGECMTCWRSSYTPKYLKHGMSMLGTVKQKLSVLNRRTNEFHGCKPLNTPGLLLRRHLLNEQERLEIELEDERKKTLMKLKHMGV